MYLTSHRVTRQSDGETGINSYLHEHRKMLGVDGSWQYPQLDYFANQEPGVLVEKEVVIKPGGNPVLSYLDIVCEDGTGFDQMKLALDQFGKALRDEPTPLFNNTGDILIYFGHVNCLQSAARSEFITLEAAALALLNKTCID